MKILNPYKHVDLNIHSLNNNLDVKILKFLTRYIVLELSVDGNYDFGSLIALKGLQFENI